MNSWDWTRAVGQAPLFILLALNLYFYDKFLIWEKLQEPETTTVHILLKGALLHFKLQQAAELN